MIRLFIGVVALLLALFVVVFWMWSIVHCLVSKLTAMQKAIWVFSMLIMPVIGSILYIIFIKRKVIK